MSKPIRIYSYSIGACLALLLAYSLRHGAPGLHASQLAPLLAMAIVGEEIVVLQRQRSGNPALSFSAPAHIAAAILLGPLSAACVAVGGVIVADGLRPAGRKFLVLNASMFGLATGASSAVFHATSSAPGDLRHPSFPALVAVLGLVATRYVVTSLILGGGYVIVTERSATFVLGETFAGEFESSLAEGSVGVLIAIAFLPGHWVVLLLLLPLVVALYRAKAIFEQLKKETHEALNAVATVIDERHPTTAEHTHRVAGLVRQFVEALKLPEAVADRLVVAARFHDIGKIAVDAATLSKVGRLTDEELAGIRRHPRLSARLLSPFHFAREIARYVEYHHERFDGRGYYSIENQAIPIESHVLIAADSFDAMTSPRPYRPALTIEEAVGELLDKGGSQFHPQIARAFAAIILEEPLESRLDSEEIRSLRNQFSRPFELPGRLRFPDWRLAATALGSLALALAWIRSVPTAVPAAIACASFLAAALWLRRYVSIRRRRRLAQNALDAGATVDVTLATSGIANGFVWLEPDEANLGYEITSSGGQVASDELSEVCDWANRDDEALSLDLESGCRLVLSAASRTGQRLALILDRDPPPSVEELCQQICASAISGHRAAAPVRLVAVSGSKGLHRAVALSVELGGFEAVRTAAGHLVANRMVDDAERRLRSLLRESDQLQRVGDDRFRIVVQLRDAQDADAVRERIAAELSKLELPRRSAPLAPRIELASDSAAEGGA